MSDKADKEIVNLATAASVGDDILIPCYVPGSTDPAQKVSGAQIKGSMTPKKGTDYWTPEERAAIVAELAKDLAAYELSAREAAGRATASEGNAAASAKSAETSAQTAQNIANTLDAAPPIVENSNGTMIALSDSAERTVKGLKLFGKTTQITTTGKNLFPAPSEETTYTSMGITHTRKTDGTIVLNGTATAVAAMYLPLAQTIPAGTSFAMSMNNSVAIGSGASTSVAMRLIDTPEYSASTQFGKTYAVCSAVNATAVPTESFDARGVQVRVDTGVTLNNFVIKPQVEIGTAATEYEPYTGGMASPNPDYPQELVSVGEDGSVVVTTLGKNLLDISTMGVWNAYSAIDFEDENTIRVYNTADGKYCAANSPVMTLRAGTTYVFSLFVNEVVSGELRFGFRARSNNGFLTSYSPVTALGRASVTYTPSKTIDVYLSVMVNAGDATVWGDVTVSQLQLEVGSAATDYEPYKTSQTLTVQTPNGLPGIPVTFDGNYTDADGQQWVCDEIDYAQGKYVRRIGQIYLDGSTAPFSVLGRTNSIRVVYSGFPNASTTYQKQMFNRFVQGAVYSQDIIGALMSRDNTGSFIMGLPLAAGTTQESVMAWLSENPVKCIYALETPVETDLTAEELAAYAALHTNYHNTTVSNGEGAWMELDYVADTKIYIDNKFAELNAAILSLGGNV